MIGVPGSADVVIIGGGAMGVSTAYHLTEVGIHDVALVERESLGAGSTSKSAGGVRLQFADRLNVRIAQRSLREFETFDDRHGVGIGFTQNGYLFLLDNASDVARFRRALTMQKSMGVPTRELSISEALELVPDVAAHELVAAMFCPLDGYVSPESVVQGYATSAAARGVMIVQGLEVTGIRVRRGRITAVETNAGAISTNTVVCAAGAWSRRVAALAGVDLPVAPERRWMHYTPHAGRLTPATPLTIDFSSGFYFHREGMGLVFGGREATLEALAPVAGKRLPMLMEAPIQSSWWGYYEMSPDHNAIVGEESHPARFLYAAGFSGHGFQQSPGVGEYLAQLIAHVTPSLDLTALSNERFRRKAMREEQFVV